MIIQARFSSAQTGLGYQFYSAAGTLLGSRITAGIVSLPETGSYAADATVPATAVGVYWDSDTSEATEDLREALATPDVPSAAAIADEVRAELATELGRMDTTVSSRLATAGYTAPSTPPTTAQIRSELATELGRIDTTVSSRLATAGYTAPSTPPTTAQIRSELATELGRMDVAVSSRNATAPDNAGIAAIQAATDSASQILLASPYVPTASPALIIPAPDSDESLTVVFCHTENIVNVARAGIVLTFKLVAVPAKSERLLEVAPATATTDASGYAAVTLQSGLLYRVTSRELGLEKTFTPTGATFDLLTLIP